MTAATNNKVLSMHNVAHLLQVHVTTARQWAAKGMLPCYRTPGNHRRFKASDVIAFAEQHSMPIDSAQLAEMTSPTTYNITAAGRAALAETDLPMARLSHTVVEIDDIIGRDNETLKKDHCTWMTREDGTRFTPDELRNELRKLRKAGFEVVTTTRCTNFSKTGHCLGHNVADSDEAANV